MTTTREAARTALQKHVADARAQMDALAALLTDLENDPNANWGHATRAAYIAQNVAELTGARG